eukprot:c55476_g1_i1 orf=127-363(+)
MPSSPSSSNNEYAYSCYNLSFMLITQTSKCSIEFLGKDDKINCSTYLLAFSYMPTNHGMVGFPMKTFLTMSITFRLQT